jgi:hypothetical protein
MGVSGLLAFRDILRGLNKQRRVKDGIPEAGLTFGVSNPALPLRVRRVLIPYGCFWIIGY